MILGLHRVTLFLLDETTWFPTGMGVVGRPTEVTRDLGGLAVVDLGDQLLDLIKRVRFRDLIEDVEPLELLQPRLGEARTRTPLQPP